MAKFKASLDYVGRILSTKKRGEEEEKEEYLRVTKGSQGKSPPLPILCSPFISCIQCHMSVLSCYLLFGKHKGDRPQHVLCPDSLELGLHYRLRRPGWRFQMCHEVSQPNSSCTNLKTHYKNSPYWSSLTRGQRLPNLEQGQESFCVFYHPPHHPPTPPSAPPLIFTLLWHGFILCFKITVKNKN